MPRPLKDRPLPGLIRVPSDESKPLKYWQAYVELAPVGGVRRRKMKRSKDWSVAYKELRRLQQAVHENPEMSTRSLTLEAWGNEYLDKIAPKKNRKKTVDTYRGLMKREVYPLIGMKRVDSLSAADIRNALDAITRPNAKGVVRSSTTAMQVHRILVVMLKYAMREGHTHRNVALDVDAPRPAVHRISALDVDQATKLILDSHAAGDPLWTLWATALFTGARQGELLGLEIDRVGDVVDLEWQLQRLIWEHGCDPFCGRLRGSDCLRRKITGPADWETRHLEGGLWLTPPKSRAGTRTIPLVDPFRAFILGQIASCDYPNPHGLVWRTPAGSPIDPRDESRAWHVALERSSLPKIRLHDARHSAVDLLYEAGVPEDVIMEVVGHSVRAVTRGYKSKGRQARKILAMQQMSELFRQSKAGAALGTLAVSAGTHRALPPA